MGGPRQALVIEPLQGKRAHRQECPAQDRPFPHHILPKIDSPANWETVSRASAASEEPRTRHIIHATGHCWGDLRANRPARLSDSRNVQLLSIPNHALRGEQTAFEVVNDENPPYGSKNV